MGKPEAFTSFLLLLHLCVKNASLFAQKSERRSILHLFVRAHGFPPFPSLFHKKYAAINKISHFGAGEGRRGEKPKTKEKLKRRKERLSFTPGGREQQQRQTGGKTLKNHAFGHTRFSLGKIEKERGNT